MPQNNELSRLLREKMEDWLQKVQHDLPIIMGKTAVDHFRENFKLGGFMNNGLQKWADVERCKSDSPWYGFDYKGEKRTFYKFTRDRKTGKTSKATKSILDPTTGKTKKVADQKRLNFSRAAT